MANREGCRSLYEAWQNHNPQISQMHTDTSDTCLPSSFIHENLRHLWIDRISKAMALHRHPSSGRRPLCRTDICGQKRASVGLPPRPVPEINPTRRIKNEANPSNLQEFGAKWDAKQPEPESSSPSRTRVARPLALGAPSLRRESDSRHRLSETSTSRAFNHLRLRTAQPPPV